MNVALSFHVTLLDKDCRLTILKEEKDQAVRTEMKIRHCIKI
jgi:hypothetical protein